MRSGNIGCHPTRPDQPLSLSEDLICSYFKCELYGELYGRPYRVRYFSSPSQALIAAALNGDEDEGLLSLFLPHSCLYVE
jgi:hypothetical protein